MLSEITQKIKLHKIMLAGILGVIFLYVSVAGIVSVTTPWWMPRGDAAQHIDYAWQIYKGDLPKYQNGLEYPKFEELTEGKVYQKQTASNHPPLFYLLHAPVIGPLFDSGAWQVGIAVGRALNIFFGILCIAALAWAGWLFGGKRKELFAVAVPALGATTYHFASLNLNYANDVLLVLFATLSFIFSYKILRNGLLKNDLIILGIISALGMATKVTYIVLLSTSLLAIVAAALIHNKNRLKALVKGSLIALLVLSFVIVSIGWFYYQQNYAATGNITKSIPEQVINHQRPYKSFETVITHPRLWDMLYKRISSNENLSILITLFSCAGIAVIYIRTRFKQLLTKNKAIISIILLMVLAAIGIFATQVVHAVGYGGFYFRYFLPLILPMALFFAYGLAEFRWTKAQLIGLASVAMAVTTIIATAKASVLKTFVPEVSTTTGAVNKLLVATANNDIPNIITMLLLLVCAIGSVLVCASLFVLSKPVAKNLKH